MNVSDVHTCNQQRAAPGSDFAAACFNVSAVVTNHERKNEKQADLYIFITSQYTT